MIARINIAGRRFGRLTAIKPIGQTSAKESIWSCICDCGREHAARSGYLRAGTVKSCGCLPLGRKKSTDILR